MKKSHTQTVWVLLVKGTTTVFDICTTRNQARSVKSAVDFGDIVITKAKLTI